MGLSLVQGFMGAVPAGSRVTITNTATAASTSTTAGSDGSFKAQIQAITGHKLAIRYSFGSTTSESITLLTFSPTITSVLPTIGGTVNDMTIAGSYGYVADSVGLRILDLSTPSNPRVVSTLTTITKAAGVAVVGQYAYLITAYNSTALCVVDISDKANPRVVSSLFSASGGSCIEINASGTMAFIGGYFNGKGNGFQVVDISNPLAPNALGFIKLNSSPQALVTADRYAYLAMGSAGVQVIDVSSPNAPMIGAAVTSIGNASRLAFLQTSIGGTLAIPSSTGLKLVSVSNPSSPSLVATVLPTTMVYDVVATGSGQVAVATGYPNNGLQTLDVNVPASARALGMLHTDGAGALINFGTSGTGLLATISSSPALNTLDTRSLARLGGVPIVSTAMAITVSGSLAVAGTNTYNQVGGNRNTLFATNNQNPNKSVPTGSLSQGGIFTSVAFSESGQWVLLGGNNGTEFQVIEVASQSVIGKLALPFGSSVNAIEVRGNYAFIAGGVGGLFIVDLGVNGRAPGIIGVADTQGVATGVDIVGNYAYVADGSRGLQVVNISNLSSPTLVGAAIATPAPAQSVCVQGQYLYLATATAGTGNGLMVFDLTNPASPVNLSTLLTTGYARKVDAIGNLVYLASDNAGLMIIDVSNPRQPVVARTVKTFSYCRDVKAKGGLVYLADDAAVQAIVAISPQQ